MLARATGGRSRQKKATENPEHIAALGHPTDAVVAGFEVYSVSHLKRVSEPVDFFFLYRAHLKDE